MLENVNIVCSAMQKILTIKRHDVGRNCNIIFDVLTSKIPNADRSKHAFVCVCVWGGCFSKIGTSK